MSVKERLVEKLGADVMVILLGDRMDEVFIPFVPLGMSVQLSRAIDTMATYPLLASTVGPDHRMIGKLHHGGGIEKGDRSGPSR